jgi:hypothetical protein
MGDLLWLLLLLVLLRQPPTARVPHSSRLLRWVGCKPLPSHEAFAVVALVPGRGVASALLLLLFFVVILSGAKNPYIVPLSHPAIRHAEGVTPTENA